VFLVSLSTLRWTKTFDTRLRRHVMRRCGASQSSIRAIHEGIFSFSTRPPFTVHSLLNRSQIKVQLVLGLVDICCEVHFVGNRTQPANMKMTIKSRDEMVMRPPDCDTESKLVGRVDLWRHCE
jgi:hypothetical protein